MNNVGRDFDPEMFICLQVSGIAILFEKKCLCGSLSLSLSLFYSSGLL